MKKIQSLKTAALARRTFLLASGAVLAATGHSASAKKRPEPELDPLTEWNEGPTIPLWPGEAPGGGVFRSREALSEWPDTFLFNIEQPYLRVFRPEKSNGRSLLVIPGGAYTFISIANEGLAIADFMTAKGYTVFVLIHRLPDEGWAQRSDVPLQDAQRAGRLIRAKSAEFGLDPEQFYAVGFSAGGHLAATLATAFDENVYGAVDDVDAFDARPTAVGLVYPVISHEEGVGHAESSMRLLGKSPDQALLEKRSPALHVTAETPPSFLVHALDDTAVPPENSMIMLKALRAAGRPTEAHFFEEGGHGFGPSLPELPAHQWQELFTTWIERFATR